MFEVGQLVALKSPVSWMFQQATVQNVEEQKVGDLYIGHQVRVRDTSTGRDFWVWSQSLRLIKEKENV